MLLGAVACAISYAAQTGGAPVACALALVTIGMMLLFTAAVSGLRS